MGNGVFVHNPGSCLKDEEFNRTENLHPANLTSVSIQKWKWRKSWTLQDEAGDMVLSLIINSSIVVLFLCDEDSSPAYKLTRLWCSCASNLTLTLSFDRLGCWDTTSSYYLLKCTDGCSSFILRSTTHDYLISLSKYYLLVYRTISYFIAQTILLLSIRFYVMIMIYDYI
jgi:hypothetical protein